jgi:hypothetical protein
MEQYNLRLWVPFVVLYAVGIAGFWAPNYVPAIAALAKGGVNEQWLGFFGSLLGSCIALLAAFIAYGAVRVQTRTAERVALQKETETLDVLKKNLRFTFQIINYLWKRVDLALEPQIKEARRTYRVGGLMQDLHLLPSKQLIEDLRRTAEGTLPSHRHRFLAVATWLESCDSIREALNRGPQAGEPPEHFQNRVILLLQAMFTGLARAVEQFDGQLAKLFEGRKRSDRFELDMIEQLDIMLDVHLVAERQMFDQK